MVGKVKPALEGGPPVRESLLPFYRVPIEEADIAEVAETLRSGWLTLGPKTEAFEIAIASYLGVKHAIAVSSCSEAIFLALKALGLGPGDEVITSGLTFASTVHAIIHTGASPILADIEDETFGLSLEAVEERVTPRTRVLLPVHFGGQACRIDEICAIAKKYGLRVVEDAAHAFGASYRDAKIGAFGDAATFSFYATKNLTTGEGGCAAVNDDELARDIRRLSYHGMSRDSWERYADRGSWHYEVAESGYKCNLNDILSSLGLSQLRRIESLLDRRAKIAGKFFELLKSSPFYDLPRVRQGNRHTWHLFVIRLKLERLRVDRDYFTKALAAENIGCSVHFIPIYKHPFFESYRDPESRFPVCEDYFSRCISLPIYPDMKDDDVHDVVEALDKLASYYAKP